MPILHGPLSQGAWQGSDTDGIGSNTYARLYELTSRPLLLYTLAHVKMSRYILFYMLSPLPFLCDPSILQHSKEFAVQFLVLVEEPTPSSPSTCTSEAYVHPRTTHGESKTNLSQENDVVIESQLFPMGWLM